MGVFGGSTTKTVQESLQVGASESGTAISVGDSGSFSRIDEFPESVAAFATAALDLAGATVAQSGAAIETLGGVAGREKTPLTEWLPIIAVGAAAIVAVSFFMRA